MQSDAMMAVYGTYWNDGKQNRQYEQDAKENEDYISSGSFPLQYLLPQWGIRGSSSPLIRPLLRTVTVRENDPTYPSKH